MQANLSLPYLQKSTGQTVLQYITARSLTLARSLIESGMSTALAAKKAALAITAPSTMPTKASRFPSLPQC